MHLAAFFLITVAGLFIDQLFIGRIRTVAKHLVAYEVVFLLLIFVSALFFLSVSWMLNI